MTCKGCSASVCPFAPIFAKKESFLVKLTPFAKKEISFRSDFSLKRKSEKEKEKAKKKKRKRKMLSQRINSKKEIELQHVRSGRIFAASKEDQHVTTFFTTPPAPSSAQLTRI